MLKKAQCYRVLTNNYQDLGIEAGDIVWIKIDRESRFLVKSAWLIDNERTKVELIPSLHEISLNFKPIDVKITAEDHNDLLNLIQRRHESAVQYFIDKHVQAHNKYQSLTFTHNGFVGYTYQGPTPVRLVSKTHKLILQKDTTYQARRTIPDQTQIQLNADKKSQVIINDLALSILVSRSFQLNDFRTSSEFDLG